jgi:hypothetical protein
MEKSHHLFHFLLLYEEVLLWQTTDYSVVRTISSSQHVFLIRADHLPLGKFVISNFLHHPTARDITSVFTHTVLEARYTRMVCVRTKEKWCAIGRQRKLLITFT